MTFLFLIMTVMGVGNAWAQTYHTEEYDYDGDGVEETYNVVYLTVGGTNGNGNSSTTPVNSWANAYKKLPNYTGTTDSDRDEAWNHNIIVVQNTNTALIQIDETIAKGNGTQGIPATITGVWPWTTEKTTAANVTKNGGMVTMHNHVDPTSTSSNKPTRIGADTKFKYIRFGGQSNCFLSMYLHDCTFDVGCSMNISGDLVPSNGALKIGSTTRKAPDMQVFLFANTYTFSTSTTDGGFNDLMKKPVTLTIKSGKFGRILSNRVTGVSDSYFKSRYVVGNPNNPLTCIVNVDIDPEKKGKEWHGNKDYPDDIAFLCAGMTQGAEYADVQFNIKRGKITTLVGAMQGNTVNTSSASLSNSSYFGRTETNILAENDNDVTIYRYYAACFGRMTKDQKGTANAAFYGKSTLNMYGGTIENGAYVSAGGVSGLVSPYNPNDYTNDKYIPYADNSAAYTNYPYMGVHYQAYDKNKTMVHVKSMLHRNVGEEPEDIDLSETVTQMNIYGGVVRGGVFGGSYGFSPELMVDYAMEKGGAIWGETNVNIYGGHIYDGVYGGGEGSSNFYNLATAANRDKFTTVATVYGNTNVNIYGGTIEGGIYGGGKGLDAQEAGKKVTITTTNGTDPVTKDITTVANEFLDIAKVYGATNVVIDPKILKDRALWADPTVPEFTGPDEYWTFTGNIYGGGALGAVEGNTNVIIKGGNITGNVFAGGLGEDGHADKAKVIGDTEANIQGGTQGDEYAVYGGAQMALVDGNTAVILQGGTVGDAYGGGLGTNTMAANVTCDATVQLGSDDGTTASKVLGSIFGANNLNGTPQGHVKVHVLKTTPRDGQGADGYDVAAVYGGGNLAAYEPTNANEFAEVLIENCDNSIEYVYGGGNAAPVPATQVTINGANAIDNAFAGGNGAGADNPGADIGYKGFFSSGAATEYGTGIATINVQGGTIHHVYGGSNTLGYIKDHAVVNVNAAGTCPMDVAELYGGGKMAPGKAAQINITCTGEGKIDNVYGGAHMADLTGDITLNINGGNIGNAFGGNNESGTINGAITVNVNWDTDACGTNSLNNVYGGGNLASYTTPVGKVGPTVNLINGTISGSAFGGGLGKTAIVTGNPKVYLNGAIVVNDIYGGGDAANVIGTANVQVDKGTVKDVYGGGNAADVNNTDVVINGGEVTMAFAGGHGDKIAEPQKAANVNGDAHLTIHGGTVAKAFAGSNSKGTITGSQLVTIVKDAYALAELHVAEVYGGGNQADGKAGTFDIGCTGSDTEGIGDLFGGAREANITGNVAFSIEGGKINRIFGGNNVSGNVAGSIQVNIAEDKEKYDCGLHVGYVYGGGQDAAYTPTTPGAYPEVNIIGGNIAHDVFGGGLGATAIVTSNPTVTISGGSVGNNVFGGGSLAETEGNPTVNVSGGTVTHDVYGGGALADVNGNTTVNLTSGAVGSAYGGALGSAEVAAKVNGDTYVHLDGSKVTETGIFGANNLNGTPTGHVKVHVTRTTPRDGFEYAVPAVYGGGNLSAYVPTNTEDFAEVLIENCDNSIEYVYGGGNAAPVPATKVTIYGANAINHAFAGGNGAGQSEDPDAPNYNPGADVGFKGYYSQGSREEYGTGTAQITVYGGTVNNVYGGSNTLGYIRTSTKVEIDDVPDDYEGNHCTLNVGTVHGGGNEAELFCPTEVILGCSDGADVIFGGANNADINGDVTMTLRSGTYGKVFGGNNQGGCVKGKITINIDETGCEPVMIGELYCCGSYAPYSVYGYNDDGTCKTSGTALYDDPEINLISFTRIGKVFGGGLGETATLYGNTHVNVNPITGIFAGNDVQPIYVLDENDERKSTSAATTLPLGVTRKNDTTIHIANEVGSIGSIYGGGNAGAVYGNTNVKIACDMDKNKHVSGADTTTEKDVAVNITGNVFGGGNEAIVSGNTNVTIGKE